MSSPEGVADRVRQTEAALEHKSDVFRKELGVSDLVLTQILFIVGLPWIGVAAKQGQSHVVLWLGAIVLFYIPSAVVVTYLNGIMPLEGGLYQWAKLGFNELTGFLVAWNLWLFGILNMSEIGLQVTQYLGYIYGPGAEWLTGAKWFVGVVSVVVVGMLAALSIVGLGLGKWLHKTGGILMLVTFATVLLLPVLNRAHGTMSEYHPLKLETPVLSLMTLNLLGKMGFGALGGFEYVAIHAGETRSPVRAIRRSVLFAAPIIGAMFILGTSSVLALVGQENVDLIAPIPQVLSEGFGRLGVALAFAPAVIWALLVIRLAQSSVTFAGNSRLPMVAGWDNRLPAWFTRLHATHRTPVNSILFVAGVTLVLGALGLLGVGKQEAFQILWNASGTFYALTYVVLFALPLFGLRGHTPAPSTMVRIVSASGLAMTLLYVALSVVPIIQVESRWSFAIKISGLIGMANLVGLVLFAISVRKGKEAGR